MKYVAFLRGINVGGRTIKMSDLKDAFNALGLKDVRTVLNTGNVAFSSEYSKVHLKKLIEDKLSETFNYSAKLQVINFEDLEKIIKAYPFKGDTDHHSYVIFLENGLEKDLFVEEIGLDKDVESIKDGNSVLYWYVLKGETLKSPFAKTLNKSKYKTFNTVRNINTLLKLIN